ncbi:DUF6919 domain-containing protein [Streptomyces sp. NPDC052023]|uniref:DUF6919 domain-containing protein n=1 Tax=Streptomyces sp. NPDC052023 TaxID=3365681 RepID=UPI0037D334C3
MPHADSGGQEGPAPSGWWGEGKTLLARWRDADRRRRAEIRTWREARAFEELAVLTARWLRGHLSWHPNGYRGGPDPATVPLAEALAAANDAGFLTEGSQPGELATLHELPWRQRAFVSGFVADPALARALCARAAEAGLVVRAYRRRVDENRDRNAVDVTTWGARVNTGMGNWVSARAVRRILPWCDRLAVREVARAWQRRAGSAGRVGSGGRCGDSRAELLRHQGD